MKDEEENKDEEDAGVPMEIVSKDADKVSLKSHNPSEKPVDVSCNYFVMRV